jgi:hypothetical protein
MRAVVERDLGANGLERHALAKFEVLGFVELAHAATSDEARDSKPIAEEFADLERQHDSRRARHIGVGVELRSRHRVRVVGFDTQIIHDRRLALRISRCWSAGPV